MPTWIVAWSEKSYEDPKAWVVNADTPETAVHSVTERRGFEGEVLVLDFNDADAFPQRYRVSRNVTKVQPTKVVRR